MPHNRIEWINSLDQHDARAAFLHCCGARKWANAMEAARPFADDTTLHDVADDAFAQLTEQDWLEAFAAHPRIGDIESLRKKYAQNAGWSQGEQSGAIGADEAVLKELSEANAAYEARHGFIFIVCATGKSAAEMLAILKTRLYNQTSQEVQNAATEQRKITHLRLEKLQP